ncbi:MAG: histidine phosphotransferase [Synechococcus sp.]|nr:histidine phosphotransferase [Synechococcus sp.]
MPFDKPQRTTRRRSSAGPVPPRRPIVTNHDRGHLNRQGPRPTFLALKDHGKVFVADMPHLSDGQLTHISKEAEEVLASLERRISELESGPMLAQPERDTLIKACTKRDVTHRFLRAIQDEQEHRRNNPAVRSAANESLPRTFLEIARHRLPGATFDSLLQEALAACAQQRDDSEASAQPTPDPAKVVSLPHAASSLPVVVSPDPEHGEAVNG